MRSYDQYCSLARALDIVGDRWTLLAIIGLLGGGLSAEAAAEHGVTILGDARDLDRLRLPDWLSGPVAS